MFHIAILTAGLFSSFTQTQTATPPERPLNYESLYQVHLKWDIENLENKLKKLDSIRKETISPEDKILHLIKENNSLENKIAELKKELLFSHHAASNLYTWFKLPERFKGKAVIPILPLIRDIMELTRFSFAYLFSPISVPVVMFQARNKWNSSWNENPAIIISLEKIIQENNNTAQSITSDIPNQRAAFQTEYANILTEISTIQKQIADLEIEKKELKHFDEFKKNFKFRYATY